jgi:hypothetical protein
MKLTAVLSTLVAYASLSAPALALETFDLGGAAKGDPSVVIYKFAGQDVVAAFVRGPGDLMFAQVGEAATGAGWTGWAPIGTLALKGSPSCVAPGSSQIDCFAVGPKNAVYHITYDASANTWTDWESLGGAASSNPSAVRTIENGDSNLRVFVRGPGNLLFMNTQDEGGDWSDWESLGVTFGGDPACSDILVFGAHCYDTSSGAADQFSDLTNKTGADVFVDHLGGAITHNASAVATGSAGDTLRVFVNGPGKRLWMKKWHGAWADWVEIPVTVNSAPGCAIKKNGSVAWCASVESNGTVKMIQLKPGEI